MEWNNIMPLEFAKKNTDESFWNSQCQAINLVLLKLHCYGNYLKQTAVAPSLTSFGKFGFQLG